MGNKYTYRVIYTIKFKNGSKVPGEFEFQSNKDIRIQIRKALKLYRTKELTRDCKDVPITPTRQLSQSR